MPNRAEPNTGDDRNPYFGRVAYAYGSGLDRPLSVVRFRYANMQDVYGNPLNWREFPTFAIVPLWNAGGKADQGFFAPGGGNHCLAGEPNRCVFLQFLAAYDVLAYDNWNANPVVFHGTLINDKRDRAGTWYRRNRTYDPRTGRFTQEDPIGLAGGLNLYGFANGDPVNFSDPFGLCPGRAKSGTICLAFFIQSRTTLHGVLGGDNRAFSTFSAPGQSRAYAIVDPANPARAQRGVNPSCFGFANLCSGPMNTNRLSVTSTEGGFRVQARLGNALVPGPSIDADLTFTRREDGKWSVSGTRDGYPSFEAYYYGEDGTVQTIVQQSEGKARQLWGCCDTKVAKPQ